MDAEGTAPVVVVGGSAGATDDLRELVGDLPVSFPGPLMVVVHFPATSRSALPQILARAGPLPVAHAVDGEAVVGGRIYVAPPDHHLLVDGDAVRLTQGPRENGHRPAIDPLFCSAAAAYGSRTIGVLLSGMLDDGTGGFAEIKRRGGRTVVIDPDLASFGDMPRNAIERVGVDDVLSVTEIAALLRKLAESDVPRRHVGTRDPPEPAAPIHVPPRRARVYSCPDCDGPLLEVDDDVLRFRCRVGHAWMADSLLAAMSEGLEGALWAAVRTLEETADLATRLGQRAGEAGHDLSAARFHERAERALERAGTIRDAFGLLTADACAPWDSSPELDG